MQWRSLQRLFSRKKSVFGWKTGFLSKNKSILVLAIQTRCLKHLFLAMPFCQYALRNALSNYHFGLRCKHSGRCYSVLSQWLYWFDWITSRILYKQSDRILASTTYQCIVNQTMSATWICAHFRLNSWLYFHASHHTQMCFVRQCVNWVNNRKDPIYIHIRHSI